MVEVSTGVEITRSTKLSKISQLPEGKLYSKKIPVYITEKLLRKCLILFKSRKKGRKFKSRKFESKAEFVEFVVNRLQKRIRKLEDVDFSSGF
jgi:hypothetical protein